MEGDKGEMEVREGMEVEGRNGGSPLCLSVRSHPPDLTLK